jgi:copper transport protein
VLPRAWRRTAAAAAPLALLGLLVAPALPGAAGGAALGHAQLVASTPSAGEVAEVAPTELRLVFSEPLEAQFSSAEIRGDDGSVVVERGGAVDPDDAFELVLPLPALDDGVYLVVWRTLSAADGHTANGMFSFGVGDTGGVTPAGAQHDLHDEADPIDTAGRWLVYAGLIAGLGVPVFAWVVLRADPSRHTLRILGALLAVACVATLGLAVRAGAESGGALLDFLTGSRNGQLQLVRALVLALGAVAVLVAAGRRPGWASAISATAAAIGIALLVAAGHAAATASPVAIAVQFVHVAAASIWLSGVAGLITLLVRPALLGVGGGSVPMTQAVPRFSALALGSIGLVAATGSYAAWSQTETLALFASAYGRTLALKVGLVAVALSIGALNFFDGGRSRSWLGGLQMRLGVEFGLALVVLVVAASLSRTPPAAGEVGVALAPVPDAFGETVPGLTLSLHPGRPGVNGVEVTATGAVGGLPAELTLDRLDAPGTTRIKLTPVGSSANAAPMPSMDHAAMPAPPTSTAPAWAGSAIVLPAGGQWDANVRLLSSDGEVELVRQRFAFTMGTDAVAEGRDRLIVDPIALVSLALVVGGALALGLGAGGWRLPRTDAVASRLALLVGGSTGALLGLAIGVSELLTG